MKRILAILLFAAMIICLSAACSAAASSSVSTSVVPVEGSAPADAEVSQPEYTPAPTEESDTVPAVEPESVAEETVSVEPAYTIPLCSEPETLTYWITMPPPASMVIEDMSEVLAYSIAEARTNVHIDFQAVSEIAAEENFNLLVAANSYPDLLLNIDNYYAGGAMKAFDDEVIMDLADLIDTYADNYKAILNEDSALRKDVITDDGNMLSFWSIDTVAVGARGPLIRQDWLDKLGMDIPETYEEYHDVLVAFKNAVGCTSPLNLSSTGYDSSGYLTAGYGISLASPFYVEEGTVKFAYLEDGCRDYVAMMNQWFADGIFTSDYLNNAGRYSAVDEPIVVGTSGLTYISTNQIDSLSTAATDSDFSLSALSDAVISSGDMVHFGDLPDTRAEEPGVSVSTNCENPALAVCWMDYFYSEEGSLLANYGQEGITYEMIDGIPTYTDVITNSDTGFDSSLVQYAYIFNQGAYYKDSQRLFCVFSDMVIGCYDVWASNLSEDRWEMPSSVSLTVEENSEFVQYYSDIETLCSEYFNSFIIGEKSMEEYDEFVESLKAMGVERCIELYQGAYDRYISRA